MFRWQSSIKHELVPISFKQAFTESSQKNNCRMVLVLLFPMDFIAHFWERFWRFAGRKYLPKVFETVMFNLNDTMRYFLCPAGQICARVSVRYAGGTWENEQWSENGDVFYLHRFQPQANETPSCRRRRYGNVCKNVWRPVASSCRSMIPNQTAIPWSGAIWWWWLKEHTENLNRGPAVKEPNVRNTMYTCFCVSKLWILLHNSLLISIFTFIKRSIDNGRKRNFTPDDRRAECLYSLIVCY